MLNSDGGAFVNPLSYNEPCNLLCLFFFGCCFWFALVLSDVCGFSSSWGRGGRQGGVAVEQQLPGEEEEVEGAGAVFGRFPDFVG